MRNRNPIIAAAVVMLLGGSVSTYTFGQAPPPVFVPPAASPYSDLERMEHDARESLRSARSAVDAFLHASQDQVERQLAADPEYRHAQDETIRERHRLEDARAVGRREEIRHAEDDYKYAQDRESRIRDAAYASSMPYQQARRLAGELNAPAAPVADVSAQRIADAIADHRLIAGMTFDEATRSLGNDSVLLDSGEHVRRYRWKLIGRTGSVTEYQRDGFRRREVVVPQYGVVGHVTATFMDGRITDIVEDRN